MPVTQSILVLCTGNSCRSQLLHGYLQQLLGGRAAVYSAGVETHGLNPCAVRVMAEDGVNIARHTSNHVGEVRARTVRLRAHRVRPRQRGVPGLSIFSLKAAPQFP